jgi:hypothetical protein
MKTADFYQGMADAMAWHSICTRTARFQIPAGRVLSLPR